MQTLLALRDDALLRVRRTEESMSIAALVAPTLLDKKPQGIVLSASQLEKWDLCKRWWAWQYVEGIRTPPHPSAILGTKVHAHLEAWLRDGTVPKAPNNEEVELRAEAIATRMVTTLINNGIQPGQGVVERRFWFTTRNGHHYTGFIDWSGLIDAFATVTDHKTSANITRYGKTEEDLHNDIQAVLYSIAGFLGFGVDTLQLFWNYGETKGRLKAKPVKTVVHLSVVAQKFEDVIEVEAAQIVAHRQAKTHPLSFPPTVSACGAFGGCPHRQRCNLTDQQLLGGTMDNGQGNQSMAERMAAAANGGAAPMVTPPPAGAPPGMPPIAGPPIAMAPPTAPPGVAPGAPPMTAPPQQPPAQQQTAYAPTVAPNPPETGADVPAAETAQTTATGSRGRPAGSKNKKTFTTEQQVYMMGVTAVIGHPSFDPTNPIAGQMIETAGELALAAFKKKFS